MLEVYKGRRSEWHSADNPGNCPVCASAKVATEIGIVQDCRFGGSGSWCLLRCDECGVVWTHPRPSLERHLYPAEFYACDCESTSGSAWSLRAINFLSGYEYPHDPPEGCHSVLEVGCGTGHNLRVLKARGLQVKGIEPESHAVFQCRTSGLDVLQGTAEAALGTITEKFDWVLLNHVIEHLDDPVQVLRLCGKRLNQGGTLTLALPCYGTLGVRFFGSHWDALDVPRHTYHFSQEALGRLLHMTGFRVLRTEFQLNPFPFARSMLCKTSLGHGGTLRSERRIGLMAPLATGWIPLLWLGHTVLRQRIAPYFRVDACFSEPQKTGDVKRARRAA